MKNLKMRYLIVLVALLIFISSCSNLYGNQQGTDVGGVDMRFIPGFIPDTFTNIPVNTPSFRVGLELINNLERDVNGDVCIYDTLSDTFGGVQGKDCKDFSIRGKEESIRADKEIVYFPDSGTYIYDNLPPYTESMQLLAELSYAMETEVLADICLNKDPTLPVEELICDPNSVKITKKELAPVTITSIEPRIYSLGEQTAVNLKMKIKKASEGDVVAIESLGPEVFNKKHLMNLDIGIAGTPGTFECIPSEPDGRIRVDNVLMKNNVREIECNAQVTLSTTNPNYKDTLIVNMRYGYEVLTSSRVVPFEFRQDLV